MSGVVHQYSRRTAATAVLLLFLLAAHGVDGSSRSVIRRQSSAASSPAMRLQFGYVPRWKVIPPSGPSEGHNSIGQEEEEEKRPLMRKPWP
ncbi:hypothetical protein BS78_06G291600 [Paspalum vaginatum]|nr:hypothetical protein BS78_06G291600 [Paspalum vaginatum]